MTRHEHLAGARGRHELGEERKASWLLSDLGDQATQAHISA